MKFEDVSLTFSKEEWAQLEFQQKCLYKEIMLENYNNMVSVGKATSTFIKMCLGLGRWYTLVIPSLQRWRRKKIEVEGYLFLTLPPSSSSPNFFFNSESVVPLNCLRLGLGWTDQSGSVMAVESLVVKRKRQLFSITSEVSSSQYIRAPEYWAEPIRDIYGCSDRCL